ncbi:1-phosphatidylinositol 4,5-bisphosphate phosphodiesterase eta-1-like isoform X2 [Oncorhynchus tshawytscha]|uniref:1-phosphatidylinositol 4,5-bisphosphate phosphodiesterase eta-1-like isoform X2 n=1 Tax=Oncorhynchus tshawytscha TaxID=74940 RepID=UPI001C3DD98F|nr:1-phosphatidylinositol 4,5-bisphosphate phosphodiesterase eta-1-like isoform X2 [Oncorhynchus tshawytscha]
MSSWVVNRKGGPQYCHHFLTDNSIFHVERCMCVMQSGTQMVKLKAGSKGLVRLFYLDEHRSCIRWRPSRKSERAKITIDSLYKVTEGRQSDIFHRHAEGSFDPACCFTVYHGNHMESLDLVTSNPEEARTWVTGLRYLMAGISDEDSLAKRQRTHDQWMKQTFEEADKNGDGLLNMEEIYQLLHKMNVNLPRRKVKHMFQEADSDDQQGTLTFEEFSVFYKMMSLRRDLYLLLMGYSDRKDHLTADELANFLRNEQKMMNVTTEYCLDVIDKFELSEENKQKGILGIEGFTSFMRSPTCDVFNPEHHEVNQDMDQPLSSYYISSSHNTYLTGDQLLSHSKTDMYAWVLQAGCRCVEVDCWDGPDGEPMVQHGYTLTSKITFKSVIETIDKYAFINNRYPVILSIENHCCIQQQKKIAQYLRKILGDKLDLGETFHRDSKQLPSPHCLQGKILIKGKRLPLYLSIDVEEGEVSDDDSADEIEDDFKLKNSNSNGNHQVESYIRKKLDCLLKESQIGDKEDTDSFSIRALLRATHVGLQKNLTNHKEGLKKSQSRSFISNLKQKRHSKSRLKSQSMDGEQEGQETSGREAGGHITRGEGKRKTIKLSRDLSDLVVFTNSVASPEGLDDCTPGNVLSFSETRAQQLVNHRAERFLCFNQRQLSRIYPSAYRIDSSNFNPQLYWNVGCQLVALNYQTEGRMMQLNRAKFMVNGGCGYALKPPPMCKGSFNPFCDDPLPAYPNKQLVLKIISGQQLPKPPDSMLGDRGEIIDPFVEVEIIGLPVDCCKGQTRVVDDNGFNPVWEENLSFTLHMAEVALVRFLVWDHDPIGRDFVGQRTVAFGSLMPGYRHVYLEGLTEASIFIHVSVHDIYGKWSPLVLNPSFTIMHFLGANKGRQLRGIRGLFNRSSKSSVDTSCGSALRKRSISDLLLRRTASAPTNRRKKSKMKLAESSTSISDRKASISDRKASISDRKDRVGAGEGSGRVWEGSKDSERDRERVVVERSPPLHAPVSHRPISMPLERLLQGQLSLCSPDQEQTDLGADTLIGTSPFDRPKSHSVELLIESSASLEHSVSTPSTNHNNTRDRTTELDQLDETSYLVIGQGGGSIDGDSREQLKDRVNPPIKAEGISSRQRTLCYLSRSTKTESNCLHVPTENRPETTLHSTTNTPAPSSSSSSSVPSSSVPPLSPPNVDWSDLQSPVSRQDSTISRLIDAVSLGNDTSCGSISALIGQFDLTADQNDLTTNSDPHVLSVMSCLLHPTVQDSSTPYKVTVDCTTPYKDPQTTTSPRKATNGPITPRKASQTPNQANHNLIPPHPKTSHADPPAPLLFSSPETTELEEVYTILDEEVLSPVSVYNLREQTVGNIQADSEESTPMGSLEPSPTKVPPRLGAEDSWVGSRRGVVEVEEPGQGYGGVSDPTELGSGGEWGSSWGYRCPSVNSTVSDRLLLCQDSARSHLMEVEINVDEDPLEIPLTLPRHNCTRVATSPTKQYAAPQSQFNQLIPSPRYAPQLSQCLSPLVQSSHQPSPRNTPSITPQTQPSLFERPPNPSTLRLNSHPSTHSRAELSFENSRDITRAYTQQHSYSGPTQAQTRGYQGRHTQAQTRGYQDGHTQPQTRGYQGGHTQPQTRGYLDGTGEGQDQGEASTCFQNGLSSSECLPGLSSMSGSRYGSFPRDRGLYSPISDCDVAYSHLDYNCFRPSAASASPYTHLQPRPQSNTQPLPQAQPQSHTQPRPQSHTQAQLQFQPRSGPPPLPLSGPTLAPPLPIPRPLTAPSPCKSKSLGDLTSEDISCNFHSKYNIISRSFITPCMKERRRMRGLGGLSQRLQSADPLTEQLRKLVTLEGDYRERDRPQSPQLPQLPQLPLKPFIPPSRPCPPSNVVPDAQEDSPPLLSRRLSSRSQSRVRHINNRARERQQEALKSQDMSAPSSVGGVVLRTKVAAGQNPPANRHSTGSYIAGYLDQLEDRGLPEGACNTLGYGYGDHYGDHYHDDSLLPTDSCIRSEPEVYFLLRL